MAGLTGLQTHGPDYRPDWPLGNTGALWFPIVGNKEVGTTIVVVFLSEVTLCLVLSKFVSFAEVYFFSNSPLPRGTKVSS